MKKLFFIILALLINASLFASPGDRRDRPSKEGPAGGREHGAFSNREKPEPPDKKTPPSDKPDKKPKNSPNESHHNENQNDIFLIEGQPQQTANFRGQRIILSDKEPQILKTDVNKKTENTLKIALYFNQPVNPACINSKNILVDNKILPEDTRMIFNKKVDSVYFEINTSDAKNLEIKNLEGINGKKVESIKVSL